MNDQGPMPDQPVTPDLPRLARLEDPTAPLNLRSLRRLLREILAGGGIDTADLDARFLIEHVTGLDLSGLLARGDERVDDTHRQILADFARRRLAGWPVARLIGEWDFYGRTFLLSPATLVPRPDTETLVTTALAALGPGPARIADLGVGSGAILVTLLAEREEAVGIGTDLSAEALATAALNARRLGVASRLRLVRGSYAAALAPGAFDLVVSNPPYIDSAAIAGLSREVRDHDPHLALDGGADGLAGYRTLAPQVFAALRPGGRISVEIGATQGLAVAAILRAVGFEAVRVERDLADLDRVVSAARPF